MYRTLQYFRRVKESENRYLGALGGTSNATRRTPPNTQLRGIASGVLPLFLVGFHGKQTVLIKSPHPSHTHAHSHTHSHTHTHTPHKGQRCFITCKVNNTIITVYCCRGVVVLWGVSLMEKWPPLHLQPRIHPPPFSSIPLHPCVYELIINLLHSHIYKSTFLLMWLLSVNTKINDMPYI